MYQNVKDKQALSQQMKIAMFDQWLLDIWEMHLELNAYKHKRKEKARIHKERVARGYTFKKKTSLKEYQDSQK